MTRNGKLLDGLRSELTPIENHLIDGFLDGRVSRRELLRHGSLLGLSLPFLGRVALAAGFGAAPTVARAIPQPGATIRIASPTPPGAVDPVLGSYPVPRPRRCGARAPAGRHRSSSSTRSSGRAGCPRTARTCRRSSRSRPPPRRIASDVRMVAAVAAMDARPKATESPFWPAVRLRRWKALNLGRAEAGILPDRPGLVDILG